jgi:hypothetical protein
LLNEIQELVDRNLQGKVETFAAKIFGKHFVPDLLRRVEISSSQDEGILGSVRKFAIAGLDIMVTEDERLYLLEVNVNPAAPPENTIPTLFQEHLVGFMKDLIDLVSGRPSPNFVSTESILEQRQGSQG